MSRKIYAAILGAGTVGTGVYKLCQSMKDDVISKTGAELVVKKVLVRNLDNCLLYTSPSPRDCS